MVSLGRLSQPNPCHGRASYSVDDDWKPITILLFDLKKCLSQFFILSSFRWFYISAAYVKIYIKPSNQKCCISRFIFCANNHDCFSDWFLPHAHKHWFRHFYSHHDFYTSDSQTESFWLFMLRVLMTNTQR